MIYITLYSKENGKQEFTEDEWTNFNTSRLTWHNLNGPAIDFGDGYKAWYIDGQGLTEMQFNKAIREIKDMPLVLRLVDPRWWVREYKESL